MTTTSSTEVYSIALSVLADLARESGEDLGLALEKTQELPDGWLFFYNTRAFLDTGCVSDALAGNGPLFVGKDGHFKLLPANSPNGGIG